jgi:hypothetical protein
MPEAECCWSYAAVARSGDRGLRDADGEAIATQLTGTQRGQFPAETKNALVIIF